MSSCNLCHVHGVIITDISYNSQNLSILSITITIIKESPWMMTIRPVESGGSTVDGINVWDLGPIGVEALRYPELESPSSESILFGALEEDPRRLGTCFEWSVAKSYFNGMELQRRTWKGLIHIPWSVANPKMRPEKDWYTPWSVASSCCLDARSVDLLRRRSELQKGRRPRTSFLKRRQLIRTCQLVIRGRKKLGFEKVASRFR